jgi:hypothetical protein
MSLNFTFSPQRNSKNQLDFEGFNNSFDLPKIKLSITTNKKTNSSNQIENDSLKIIESDEKNKNKPLSAAKSNEKTLNLIFRNRTCSKDNLFSYSKSPLSIKRGKSLFM